jgi:hypothetical protein
MIERDGYKLAVGEEIEVHFRLAPLQIKETVTVSSTSQEVIDTSSDSVFTSEFVERLPVNDRSLLALSSLRAGTSLFTNKENATVNDIGLQYSINGINKRSNIFLLDGTPINNGLNLAGGADEGFHSLEATREFRVLSQSYDASYGRAAGGIVLMVSRSGASDFHGSIFEYHRNESMDARNFFDNRGKPDFMRNQFGGSIGGPILKQKLFFFVASEYLRERLGETRDVVVPDMAARAGLLKNGDDVEEVGVARTSSPYLALFPVPNGAQIGGGLARYSFTANQLTSADFFQGRLDFISSDSQSFYARYTAGESSRTEPLAYPQFLLSLPFSNHFLTLEKTRSFSGSLVGSARIGYARTVIDQFYKEEVPAELRFVDGAPQFGRLAIGGLPVFGGTQPARILIVRNWYDFSYDLAFSSGRHFIRAGGAVSRVQDNEVVPSFVGGQYVFPDIKSFLLGRPASFIAMTADSQMDRAFRNTIVGLYLQDEIRLRSNLHITIGARYDFAGVVKDRYGRQAILNTFDYKSATRTIPYTDITDTPYRNPSLTNIAPRLSLAWRPFTDGRTVIRGGAGIFNDLLLSNVIARTGFANPPFNTTVAVIAPSFPRQSLDAQASAVNVAVTEYFIDQPHALKWNLAIERELPAAIQLSAGYVATRGLNLIRSGGVNHPASHIDADGRLSFSGPKLNPNFNSIEVVRSDGDSYYHALQIVFAKRGSSRVGFTGSYTFSRTIDNTQGLSPNEETGQVPQAWVSFLGRIDRGLASFHRKHIFNFSFYYDLRFKQSNNVLANYLINGWQVSGIILMATGLPFTPGIQTNRSNSGFGLTTTFGLDRPDWAAGRNAQNALTGHPDKYFDTTAFVLPPRGVVGNAGRNTLIGPGLKTLDIGIKKALAEDALGEKLRIDLTINAFNILNHPNFGLPARIVFAGLQEQEAPLSSAGRIQSTTTSARQVQIGIRASF